MSKFFYLQKSDRRTIIILLCIIVVSLAVIQLTTGRQEEAPLELIPSSKGEKGYAHKNKQFFRHDVSKVPELFPFDPNTADSTELLRLGLKSWQVRNIYKYREAGGVFRKPSDFARLYGLTAKQYQRLKPYMLISVENHADSLYNYEPASERDTLRYPVKLLPDERIVLNLADTNQLRKVPGIGSHFARQIVEYRRRLGGYYRIQQLLEIENFPETAISFFIIPDSTQLKKINLNRLSMNELKRHPYINFYQAREIVDYRRLHGRLEDLRQLSLSRNFPPEATERLEPYVEY